MNKYICFLTNNNCQSAETILDNHLGTKLENI